MQKLIKWLKNEISKYTYNCFYLYGIKKKTYPDHNIPSAQYIEFVFLLVELDLKFCLKAILLVAIGSNV